MNKVGKLLRSPLWLCLLFTLLVRIWLVIHNNAILEGDEALVGIQAESILRGAHPIYFYAHLIWEAWRHIFSPLSLQLWVHLPGRYEQNQRFYHSS